MLIDNSPVSYGNLIVDWQLGDDRIFNRTVDSTALYPGDSISDAFLTLKTSPIDLDADALVQKHITTAAGPAGQISGFALAINVFSGDYQGLVSAGTVVWYDIRIITARGNTWTVETGSIEFQQNVTQASKAGVPAVFPADGQPRFRGFAAQRPDLDPSNTALYNTGDFLYNLNPLNGNGYLWSCSIGGAPGTWVTISGENGTMGPPGPQGPPGPPGPQGPPGSGTGTGDPHFLGYASTPPSVGTFTVCDYFLNLLPSAGAPEGWVYCTDGLWHTKGIVGDTAGL